MLREHGQSAKYAHEIEGYNGRLDAIQAGILRVKLGHLVEWNDQRRAHAQEYDELLAGSFDVARPVVPRWSHPVYHLYVVRVLNRAVVQQDLMAAGITTGIHYPEPLHLCKPYRNLGYRANAFPIAEDAARQVLSLPMYPELSSDDQRVIASALCDAAAEHSPALLWYSC